MSFFVSDALKGRISDSIEDCLDDNFYFETKYKNDTVKCNIIELIFKNNKIENAILEIKIKDIENFLFNEDSKIKSKIVFNKNIMTINNFYLEKINKNNYDDLYIAKISFVNDTY